MFEWKVYRSTVDMECVWCMESSFFFVWENQFWKFDSTTWGNEMVRRWRKNGDDKIMQDNIEIMGSCVRGEEGGGVRERLKVKGELNFFKNKEKNIIE